MSDFSVDVAKALSSLKDFQRDSVEYVFDRLFLDPASTNRFLVADEVGLGKTLVAKGIIARTLEHLGRRGVKRIDIIYICSNADIARQNVNRLNVVDEGVTLPTRITKLPMKVRDLEKNPVNFISLTPGTSFDLGNSMGQWGERVMLYWLLKDAWNLRGRGPQNLLQGGVQDREKFGRWIRKFDRTLIDEALAKAFIHRLAAHAQSEREEGKPDIRSRFEELSKAFTRGKVSQENRRACTQIVGELRGLLAETCLEALEPDLIILDEFQRFKNLLHGDDAPAALARGMFEYAQETEHGRHPARVLLLSATPYKMYTVADEGEDDHYRDFVETLGFLLNDRARTTAMEALLQRYRRELFRMAANDGAIAREAKEELEAALRTVMVRTERLSVTEDRNGMLVEVPVSGMKLEPRDVESYLTLQQVADVLDQGNVLEYWKSAPYLLNFMDSYQLKHSFRRGIESRRTGPELSRALSRNKGFLLPWRDIVDYSAVDPCNARLRALMDDTVGAGAWQLLWIPPTSPYYAPGGPFADARLRSFTKRLIFSSWVVVPKVISCLVSYEAERHAMKAERSDARNTQEERKKRRGLLQLTRSEVRLTGLPVLALMYPSVALADLCDPLVLAAQARSNGTPTPDDVVTAAMAEIEDWLKPVIRRAPKSGPEDEAWYWAAPILLDLEWDQDATKAWFRRDDLASLWAGAEDEDGGDQSAWTDHVERARGLLRDDTPLGRPPADLPRVLALLGVSGPGTCALRAIARVASSPKSFDKRWARDAAARVGWGFRSLFNKPEAMAVIRGLARSATDDEPYWRLVLEYCLNGGIQAVLDEYAHGLRESEGLTDKPPTEIAAGLADAMVRALTLRTTAPRVDELRVAGGQVRPERRAMRGHFALSFGQERSEVEEESQRPEQVREAFNSPFWPFVLATTSVGQEGLDFHTYCHAVVHWNLPSNPVDLEQREGRVHRYKGHAVRKNVATKHGGVLTKGRTDPWKRMFAAAITGRSATDNDLVPFWLYPVDGGARIERHVPSLPLSREIGQISALRRSLAAYRMVFGQPRQDDLLEYLLRRLTPDQLRSQLDHLRIDLSPPTAGGLKEVATRLCPRCHQSGAEPIDAQDDGNVLLACPHCGNSWPDQTEVRHRKTAGSRGHASWSVDRVLAAIEQGVGADEARIARVIYEWTQDHGLSLNWPPASVANGRFMPLLRVGNTSFRTFWLYATGRIEFDLKAISSHPPFDDPQLLDELVARIENALSRRIPPHQRQKYPSARLSELAEGSRIDQFLETFDWVLDRVRSSVEAAPLRTP